ncbi:nucleotidyltransferase family protein [bacterium]|nr:nucleotidyltransferase family protein [bacterium]
MSTETILTLLKNRKEALFMRFHLKNMALFGSYSRTDFNNESDIDILVEFKKTPGFEFIALADELEKLLKNKVDLVSKNGIKPKYYKFIENDLIYV